MSDYWTLCFIFKFASRLVLIRWTVKVAFSYGVKGAVLLTLEVILLTLVASGSAILKYKDSVGELVSSTVKCIAFPIFDVDYPGILWKFLVQSIHLVPTRETVKRV